MKEYKVKKVVRGIVEAEIIVINGSFSFLGDIDLGNSEIIAGTEHNKGKKLASKILIMEETKGSSGGALVLQTLKTIGLAPAALISVKPADFNLTEGAILNAVPYASHLPFEALNEIKTGQNASLNLETGILKVY